MELKWLGTAGFEFKTKNQVFFIDPYLSRNQNAYPKQSLAPSSINNASQIFISHGHFDHIQDVPQIASQSKAAVYCSNIVVNSLQNNGLSDKQIKTVTCDQKIFNFENYSARAFFSEHIKFDKKLLISTLLKINISLFKHLPLLNQYPCGQVLSWRFNIENKTIQFFGSGGSSVDELERIGDKPIDILLVPLQGHTDICRIGLDYVKYLKPKIVIPHHHDNFYPPISKSINIKPFIDGVKSKYKKTKVIIPKINEVLTF